MGAPSKDGCVPFGFALFNCDGRVEVELLFGSIALVPQRRLPNGGFPYGYRRSRETVAWSRS
jgi:hypothetical protein